VCPLGWENDRESDFNWIDQNRNSVATHGICLFTAKNIIKNSLLSRECFGQNDPNDK
jgi:hypothetical protein